MAKNSKWLDIFIQDSHHDLQDVKEKCSNLSVKIREEGNKVYKSKPHNKTVHLKILKLYSRSLAYAPIGSEEFALAISNRSILLLHLKKYDECIVDINLGLTVTKSDITKFKLLVRKIKCLKYLGKNSEAETIINEANSVIESFLDSEIKKKLIIELKTLKSNKFQVESESNNNNIYKLEHSDQLPYISDAITLGIDKKYGKHFKSTRNIKSAEILIIEKAFCAYPGLKSLYITCSHCLRSTFTSIPCHKCTYAVYCSIKCQKEAYEEYHDIECSIYPSFFADLLLKKTNRLTHWIYLFTTRFFIKFLKSVGVEEMIKVVNRVKSNNNYLNEHQLNLENLLTKYKSFEIFYGLLAQTTPRFSTFNDTLLITLLKNSNFFKTNIFFQEHLEELKNIMNSLYAVSNTNTFQAHYENFQKDEDATYDPQALNIRLVGTVINGACSFFNHSCIPNVNRFFLVGPKMVMYSTRPVKKGEQLFMSYGPLIQQGKLERTERLQKYRFECNCEACTENWPVVNKDYYNNVILKEYFTNKNEKLSYFIKNVNTLYHFQQPAKQWDDDHKKNIEELKRIIDFSYSSLNLLDASAINSLKFSDDLNEVLCKMYVDDDFVVPNKC